MQPVANLLHASTGGHAYGQQASTQPLRLVRFCISSIVQMLLTFIDLEFVTPCSHQASLSLMLQRAACKQNAEPQALPGLGKYQRVDLTLLWLPAMPRSITCPGAEGRHVGCPEPMLAWRIQPRAGTQRCACTYSTLSINMIALCAGGTWHSFKNACGGMHLVRLQSRILCYWCTHIDQTCIHVRYLLICDIPASESCESKTKPKTPTQSTRTSQVVQYLV